MLKGHDGIVIIVVVIITVVLTWAIFYQCEQLSIKIHTVAY